MVKNDFLVVGSSTLDIFVRTSHIERIDISGRKHTGTGGKEAERLICISFGSKTDLESLELFPGGSAANSAVAMQRLGSKVALLSCVGKDQFGDMVLADLKKHGIDTSQMVLGKSLRTGLALNLTAPSGEKSILVHRGANAALGPEHLKEEIVRNSRHIFMTSLVSRKNFQLFLKLVRLAKKHRKPIIFAPSISMLRDWMPQLRKLHAHFAVSIVNFEEGGLYTGKDKVKEILKHLPGSISVVSRDVEGAYAKGGGSFFHVNSLQMEIADTCGAGDAFSGAFAHYYFASAKRSVAEALANAICIASLKLTIQGSRMTSSAADAASFIRKHRKRLKVKRI